MLRCFVVNSWADFTWQRKSYDRLQKALDSILLIRRMAQVPPWLLAPFKREREREINENNLRDVVVLPPRAHILKSRCRWTKWTLLLILYYNGEVTLCRRLHALP